MSAEEPSVALLRYLDVVLVLVGAPILLLIGVPAVGYGAGAGAWILLRVVGVGVDRYASATAAMSRELPLRLLYLIGRLFGLAMTIILVRKGAGRGDGLATLLVIVFAFTVQLATAFATRPRRR